MPAAFSMPFQFLLLGGEDIEVVDVFDFAAPTVTGNQDITTPSGVQPDFIMLGLAQRTATALPSLETRLEWGMGMGAKDGGQGCVAVSSHDNVVGGITRRYQRTNAILAAINAFNQTLRVECALAASAGWPAGGFRLNWSTAPTAALNVIALCIKGPRVYVSSETQKTSTGTKATTGIGFKPSGLLAFSFNNVAATTIQNDNLLSMGFASDVATGALGSDTRAGNAAKRLRDDQAANPTVCKTDENADTVLRLAGAAADAAATAELSSWDSDGFTLNWLTADATAREFVYAAFGPLVPQRRFGGEY